MLSLTVVPLFVLAAQAIEIDRNNRTLELDLRVVEAFERGPVVLEVSITNRGTKPLFIMEATPLAMSWLSLPPDWEVSPRRPQICRQVAGLGWPLGVGETFAERHTLHHVYRSDFPAGAYQVAVTWSLRTVERRQGFDGTDRDVPGRLAASPTKSFPIAITAATGENRKALAKRLEAEFAALPALAGRDKEEGSAFQRLCDKVIFAPHGELIPLALRLLDRSPIDSKLWERTCTIPHELVETIFAADAASAHRLFVDRLLAAPVHDHSFLAFSVWWKPARELGDLAEWVFVAHPNVRERLAHKPWLWLEALAELPRWFLESAPRMLPDGELHRLAEAKDPRVRAAVANNFGPRLGR